MTPIDSTRVHCVDPETFAAWVDGGLPAPDAARVETHLASCARCQAMLAAFSQMDNDVAPVTTVATVLPFWSRRPVHWTAAALVAAASLTMWTMTRPLPPSPVPVPSAPVPAPVQMAEAPPVEAPVAPPVANAPARTPAPRLAAPSPPPPPAPVPVPAPPPVMVTATPPPVAVSAIPMPQQEQVLFSVPGALAPPRVVFEVIAASEQNAPVVAGRFNTSAPRGGAGRGGAAGGAAPLADATIRRTPARWRVTAASGVERSLTQGQTWEPVTLDPPFVLTAGSAPYQNVCWLVGQDGVVLRTTNGTSFERMTAPDKVHLIFVGATDALRARVTAIDGRVFETTDGGVTWRIR